MAVLTESLVETRSDRTMNAKKPTPSRYLSPTSS